MKAKEIKYVNTDNPKEVDDYLSELFEKAVQCRDLAQEVTSGILHFKTSIDKTSYDKLKVKHALAQAQSGC